MAQTETRDVPLSPGVYAHIQDMNRGAILTFVGPCKINGNDLYRPVIYDASSHTFIQSDAQRSQRPVIHVREKEYAVLHNPALDKDGKVSYPQPGVMGQQDQPTLAAGQTVNIPGPIDFALWPEQSAQVIQGHKLDSNQYLLVRIVDSVKARKNWASARVEGDADAKKADELDFTTGALNVIKGTSYKFFMPCTGIEVLRDDEVGHQQVAAGDGYVRNAVSLETLEYCILLDESGAKRYERGTRDGNVVFPKPTEMFWKNDKGDKVFRAYELTPQVGVYCKVIADYTDEDGTEHKAPESMFLTGNMLYFPRPEHAIIKYGNHARQFATVIPQGKGRYVLKRATGEITLVRGHAMYLPHPEEEVFVRKIVSPELCQLYWPGDTRKLQHHQQLAQQAAAQSATKRGYLEAERGVGTAQYMSAGLEQTSSYATRSVKSLRPAASTSAIADVISRGTTYTPPRILTLDTELEDAISVPVPEGHAVMVVPATGPGRVVQGRATVILEYDEELAVLHMSTAKPKTTDVLAKTVYLNILNNKVSDVVSVQTADHVQARVYVSYCVNFTGDDPQRWFAVDNYVKLLCDHARSMLKGAVRKLSVKDFYAAPENVVRDTILGVNAGDGKARAGMLFAENGMHVVDVDVLSVTLVDGNISNELVNAQYDALTKTLELENRKRALELDKELQAIEQQRLTALAETAQLKAELQLLAQTSEQKLAVAEQQNQLAREALRLKIADAGELIEDLEATRRLARRKAEEAQQLADEAARQALHLDAIEKETESVVARYTAAGPGLTAAVATLSDTRLAADLGKAVGPLTWLSGSDFGEVLERVAPGFGKRVTSMLEKLSGASSFTSFREDE